MNKIGFKMAKSSLLALAFLILSSCAPSPQKPVYSSSTLDTANMAVIGIFPVVYDRGYAPPWDVNLDEIILRQTERTLSAKGYKLKFLGTPEEAFKDARFSPLEVYPSTLLSYAPKDVDAVMQIRITFHFGIKETQRYPDYGRTNAVQLFATARLISREEAAEIWRDKGRARKINSADFQNRLNYGAFTFANELFKTLPDRKN